MCGFVALFHFNARHTVDVETLRKMTAEQRHRGPDDVGFATFSLRAQTHAPWAAGQADRAHEGGFGFNRLSIRDLSPAGHQPMASADGRLLMVFNGEIYNADDERPALVKRGHTFRGSSDSEVLIEMFREYGVDETLRRINGMFSIVLADLDRQRLVIVRDRLGIKPLYTWRTGSHLAVASEAKSFFQHPDFVAKLDRDNLAEHLVFRSCAASRHLLAGVQQVEPGEVLEIDPNGEVTRRSRYWRPGTTTTWTRSYAEAVDAVDAAVDRGVRTQLVSDVPVGCQFSAGVDSSLVSAYANHHQTKGQYQTFSIVVDDRRYDETPWIAEGERRLAVQGHRFRLSGKEFAERLESATWHLDQPLDHMNSIGIMLLAERSREHVTVLLSGEGADETFCGYSRFHRVLLRPVLGPIAPLLAHVPRVGTKLAGFDASRGATDRDWFIRSSSPVMPEHVTALTGDANAYEAAMDVRRAMFPTEGDLIARCRAYELETFLVGLLKRQDKMTMAHSMENRVPLLDHDIVDLVSGMPASYCVDLRPRRRERNTKRLLKKVACRHFPKSYVYRRKQGFGLPIAEYFQSTAMQPLLDDLMTSAARRGLFDARALRRWREQLHDPFIVEAFWVAIAFELWARQVLDGSSRPTMTTLPTTPKGESSWRDPSASARVYPA